MCLCDLHVHEGRSFLCEVSSSLIASVSGRGPSWSLCSTEESYARKKGSVRKINILQERKNVDYFLMILTAGYIHSFKIHQHTSHNVQMFAKPFARIFLRLLQLWKDGKNSNYRYREGGLKDFTDTNPENNWYQFYTNYKWIGTKWKDYRLLVL